jgi:hypothetical protein
MSLQFQPVTKSCSINDSKRFIAVICDVGNNRFDSLLLALVVIAAELGHGESLILNHAASFSYGPCRSKANPGEILQHQ